MTVDEHPPVGDAPHAIKLNRHGPEFRENFEELAQDFHGKCPVAWNSEHGGYWFVSGAPELFEIARKPDLLSNDNDLEGVKKGYVGVAIPHLPTEQREKLGLMRRGGFIEMDPPVQRDYRQALNPYLSPAAVARWQPLMDEITRATLNEVIETGEIDFVEQLANIMPAVMTMAILGLPLVDWEPYCEPTHAVMYTPPNSPDMARVRTLFAGLDERSLAYIEEIRKNPRPGLIDALINADIDGSQVSDHDILGTVSLLIGGGFDTTTALTAHALEWLSDNPEERERLNAERGDLLNSATEEFLRYFTPAGGDGRTVAQDCEIAGAKLQEGDRLWLSWAMANRDERLFEEPNEVQLDRQGNRHNSFGLGIHRCIGSNFARAMFKTMITHVFDRMPDFKHDPERTVHYQTVGVINGMQHLHATFTPGERIGPGFDETLAELQVICDEQRLAEPVTVHKQAAVLKK